MEVKVGVAEGGGRAERRRSASRRATGPPAFRVFRVEGLRFRVRVKV